jgi:hypothetical protein
MLTAVGPDGRILIFPIIVVTGQSAFRPLWFFLNQSTKATRQY